MSFLKAFAMVGLLVLSGCNSLKIPVTELHNKEIVNLPAEVHRIKAAKAPTVILLHGCGGAEHVHFQSWIKVLNSWGYNAVVVHSIYPRTGGHICNRLGSVVSHEQRSVDAYDTAKWVLKQEWATDKVGVIGFSHGGGGVLFSAEERFVKFNFGQQIIAAGVAYYPGCQSHQMFKAVIPVQIHIGADDDWTLPGLCQDLAKNWKSELHIYEGATHGFDQVGYNQLSHPDYWGKRHWLIYNQKQTELSRERTKQFLDQYLK